MRLVRAALVALTAAALACSLHTTGSGEAPPASTGDDASPLEPIDARVGDVTSPPPAADARTFPGSEASPTGDDAEADAYVDPDALILDPDAWADAGTDDAGAVECDLDHDGHKAKGETCGGDDCCDYDGRAYPGEQAYFETANACGSFDYDCDGTTASRYPLEACKLGFFNCSGDGFAAQTACGTSSDFVSCGYSVFSCSENKKPRIQPCR